MERVPEDRIGLLIRSALEEDFLMIPGDAERSDRCWRTVCRQLGLPGKDGKERDPVLKKGNMES